MATKLAPRTLGPDGRKLWTSIQREYQIDGPAELAILRSLCQTVDRLADCRAIVEAEGLTTLGTAGQPRPHPLLQVEAEARRALLAHARALRIAFSEDC